MSGELLEGGSVKTITVTYSHLWVPRYGHSVPVQELLKEPCWDAFSKG